MKLIKNVLTASKHADFPLVRFTVANVKGAGKMTIAATDEGICWMGMTDSIVRLKKEFPNSVLMRDKKLDRFAAEIEAVWKGRKKSLSVPLVLTGTGFQMLVWSELLKIKSGATLTYQDIAKNIGKPAAVRAVGTAVGANPLTLLVPLPPRLVKDRQQAEIRLGAGGEKAAAERRGN